MSRTIRIYLIVLSVALSGAVMAVSAAKFPSISENYVDTVDRYLKASDKCISATTRRLEARRRAVLEKDKAESARLLPDLAEAYSRVSVDSALSLYYRGLELARELGDKRLETLYMYRMSRFLPLKGLSYEGMETYGRAKVENLEADDFFDYYKTGNRLFYAVAYTCDVDSVASRYIAKAIAYADSAAMYATANTIEARYYRALAKIHTKEQSIAIAELNDVLARAELTDVMFANAALTLSYIAAERGNTADARYYNAISAISELAAGSRHTSALNRLGKILYAENDHRRAFDYLVFSLEAALHSGSRVRAMEISEVLPMVIRTERRLEARRTSVLYVALTVLIVALIVFGALLYYAFRTRRKLRRVRAELAGMNNTKDHYIRKLISLCGVYLAALENFNKLAGRKIKVNQINDLLDMVESGKIIREQLQKFYEVFDEAFLMVYPDFVERVNDLLHYDRRLSLGDDGHLGTELRILAFMRLGMDDSAQIAKFLGLSLNTVYTYRNKVKSRSVDRDNFEKNIMNIRQTI